MYLLKSEEPGVACCRTRSCRACAFCICRATDTRNVLAGSSAPSNLAFTSGIACVWVFAQLAKALAECIDATHNEAVAAPAMRRHLEIAMVLGSLSILADNDAASGWFQAKPFFWNRRAVGVNPGVALRRFAAAQHGSDEPAHRIIATS